MRVNGQCIGYMPYGFYILGFKRPDFGRPSHGSVVHAMNAIINTRYENRVINVIINTLVNPEASSFRLLGVNGVGAIHYRRKCV